MASRTHAPQAWSKARRQAAEWKRCGLPPLMRGSNGWPHQRQAAVRGGDYYWIALDGSQLLRGKLLSEADELQPKFIDAVERAGR